MAHRRTAYNRSAAPAIRPKSRQQCASESGEVLEIRNRFSFKDHAAANLQSFFAYYERSRTHLALAKDAPEPRAVEQAEQGQVTAIPQVEGLHHRYQRRAA